MAAGLSDVISRVDAAARRSGRDPTGVIVVAVSKEAAPQQIMAAYQAGVRDFGENRGEALVERAAALPADVRWHFVGRLQGNKVRRVRPLTHLLHSLDRPALAEYWVKGPGTPPPVLIQVNVSGEERKTGFSPDECDRAVESALSLGLEVRGLMTMAPLSADSEGSRPVFSGLRRLQQRLAAEFPSVVELSMGMTDDFEVAVEEGATILRVGRAIFRGTSSED